MVHNQIKMAKLVSGEVVIGKYNIDGNLADVLSVQVFQGGDGKVIFKLFPMFIPFDKDVVTIGKSHIMCEIDSPKEVLNGYRGVMSGLVIPDVSLEKGLN